MRTKSVDTTELEERHCRLLSDPQAFEYNRRANVTAANQMMFEDFGSVRVPALILAGHHSKVLGPKAARRVAPRFPNARVEVFRTSAHAPQLEEPARFAEVVGRFVREAASPAVG